MRFIDADELINQGYEIVVDGLQYDTCNKSIDIDDIPTAYDIDKIVGELEKSNKWVNETNEYCDDDGNDYIPLSKAIEIVKQGGVDDDVFVKR